MLALIIRTASLNLSWWIHEWCLAARRQHTMPVVGENAAAETELGTTPANQRNRGQDRARQLLFGIFFNKKGRRKG